MMFYQTSFGKSRRFEGIFEGIWKDWRLFFHSVSVFVYPVIQTIANGLPIRILGLFGFTKLWRRDEPVQS